MISSNIEFPKFSPAIYGQIALNDLVTYAVYFLSQSRSEINAEDIVATCFKLFPERFQLRGYPEWPDSTVVNKRWLDCRAKGLVHGSTAGGFSLTAKGLVLAEKISANLSGNQRLFRKPGLEKVGAEKRTRAGRFVGSLEMSEAFQKFSAEGPSASITEFDFRNMLLCTMESSAATLRSNLDQFKQYVLLYKRNDLLGFLDFCTEKFNVILTESKGAADSYRGGMVRQKIK